MAIKKVTVLGAFGDLGSYIVPALFLAGFHVTAITRPGRTAKAADIPTIEAAYDDEEALTAAFQSHDAVVEAFNPSALIHQRTIVRAALAAHVKHLITNEFGADTYHPHAQELPILDTKIRAHHVLEEELAKAAAALGEPPQLAWTGIITGIWYDFAIRTGIFWVDASTRTITRYGSGEQKVTLSRASLNGGAVVAVLRDPQRFRKRPAYFGSQCVSTNELVEIANDIFVHDGDRFKIVDVPDVAECLEEGQRLWQIDTEHGVVDRLHSEAYVKLVLGATFDERNHFGMDFEAKLEPEGQEDREDLRKHLLELLSGGDG